jgi:magnesium-transporting ATPase (P-type)
MEQTTYSPVGNCTEVAFLKFLQDAEIPVHLLIQKKLGNIRAVCPFSSVSKRSITVVRNPDNHNVVTFYLKGAPEEVIRHCSNRLVQGQEVQIDADECLKNVKVMASHPLRVLTFAYLQMNFSEWERYEHSDRSAEQIVEELLNTQQLPFCYIGSFGLRDTLRPRVQSCVQYARDHAKLGIRLVSGDHFETAKNVAIKAGILKPEETGKQYSCMEAHIFRDLVEGVEQYVNE